MKKSLLLCCALLALAAPTMVFADANGGLDLTAAACNTNTTPPPSSTFNFDCIAASAVIPQELFACFRVTTAQDSFVGMDVDLDLIVNDPGLPDWWHFESCNASGFALTLARNSALCVGALSPWGTQNAGGAGFTPSTHGPNTGHFHGAAARSLPFKLNAATNYFAFNLDFYSDNSSDAGGPCAGCARGANLVWNSASITNVRSIGGSGIEAAPYPVSGPGIRSDCVTWGAGAPNGCQATPTRSRTWGQLKSLYR